MSARGVVIAAILLAAANTAAVGTGATLAPVSCDVLVLGADGVPAAGLVRDDFEVLSDSAPAPLLLVSRTPAAQSVSLLIDMTTSQPLKRYEVVAAIGTDWLPSLGTGDRARIATVGSPPTIGAWMTIDRPIAPSAAPAARVLIDRAAAEPSPIWDNAVAVMESMASATSPKNLVLLTDGRSAGNANGLEDVARLATASDVVISSVSEGWDWLVPPAGDQTKRVRPDASLRWLADMTGGLYLEDAIARRVSPRVNSLAYVQDIVRSPNQPGPLLARIMSALHQRYRLSFTGTADGRPHTLDVRVRKPGLVVKAKRSYLAK